MIYDRVSGLATSQYGTVNWCQLRQLGLSARQIQIMVAKGYLRPVFKGVYAVGHTALPVKGQWMGAVLACGEGAVLSHRSAAALWNMLPTVTFAEVSRRRSGHHRIAGIRIHRPRSMHPSEMTVHERIPVTTVARTLVDLAACLSIRRLERALAAADTQNLLRWSELEQAVDRARFRRGYSNLAEIMVRADPRVVHAASETERLLYALCISDPEIPRPEMNTMIEGRIVDFVWKKQRLIAETDGRGYHSDPFTFEDDRDRDGAMLEAGYRTVRITYRMVSERPADVARRLKRLLAEGEEREPSRGRVRR